MLYKVLITTSGTGSRLGELTKKINKALVEIKGKPAIDYVLRSYPEKVEVVITLGYLGEQVKEELVRLYPKRKFTFVEVDKYEGPGSSLGYSMLAAKDVLRSPFIFHCCDTIVIEDIPAPEYNWIGGFVVDKENTDLPLEQYRTHKVKDGKIIKLNDKGVMYFESVHIGLIGIKDYELFWKTMEDIYQERLAKDPEDSSLSDVHVLDDLIRNKKANFKQVPFSVWLDTGNPDALARTEEYLEKK